LLGLRLALHFEQELIDASACVWTGIVVETQLGHASQAEDRPETAT
jgi:hypothetical protein